MNPYSNKVFAHFQFKDPDRAQNLLSQGSSGDKNPFSVSKTKPLVILFLLVLGLGISLLPWPSRIVLTMPSGRISTEGELIQEGAVHLEGWQYNYLFRRDCMKLKVEVMDLTLSGTDREKHEFHTLFGDFMHMTQLIYVTETNGYELSHISIANDRSWCLIQIGPRIYFGCTNPYMDAAAIVNECRAVIY